jgi:hypothetical protein
MGGFIGLDHTKNGLLDEIPEQYQERSGRRSRVEAKQCLRNE